MGFRKLVFLGILLVVYLVLTDSTDAKKSEFKKKEVETSNWNSKENTKNAQKDKKKFDSSKEERVKKSTESSGDNSKFETKKYKIKEGTKYTVKDERFGNDKMNPKSTRSYEKVKKYKVVENEPSQQYTPSKTKSKKLKHKVAKEETVDELYKSFKKTSQKKSSKEEDKMEKIVDEDLNILNDEENVNDKEENNQKKKKYKLVEVVLEEDVEDIEGNETIIEVGEEDEELENFQRTEREEIIEKVKTTHSVKPPKTKNSPNDFEPLDENSSDDFNLNDEGLESKFHHMASEVESLTSKYNDPESVQTCKPAEDDPNRKGPRKLTLYVIEEEIDGRIKKRVVSEEDGVSMCEVADLMKEQYYGGL